MGFGELVGMKNKFGYSSYLMHIFTADSNYYGQTVSLLDEDGNTFLTGVLDSTNGVCDIPTTYRGTITFQVNGENLATVKTTFYGTYNVEIKSTIIYTFKLDESNSDPASRVSYQDDCAAYSPAYMDFVNGAFVDGDWALSTTVKEFFMPKPAMVLYDGTIDYYLDPDDYNYKEDGVTPSDIADSSYGGNVMMVFPHTWVYRRTNADGDYLFSVSNKQVDENYIDLHCHKMDGSEADYFGWGTFEGSLINSVMRSLSGQSGYNNDTTANELTYIGNNNGAWWSHNLVAHWFYIVDLLVLLGRSTNLQETYGMGVVNAAAAISTGTMNDKGLFWGETAGTAGVKVLGIENFWGNRTKRMPSWQNISGTQKVKLTYGTEDGSSTTGWNTTGSGYISVTSATPAGTSGGYINKCKVESYGRVPYNAAGSATTYECDGLWFNNSQSNVARVGGSWSASALAGACVSLSAAASHAGADVGAGLSLTQPAS